MMESMSARLLLPNGPGNLDDRWQSCLREDKKRPGNARPSSPPHQPQIRLVCSLVIAGTGNLGVETVYTS